MAIKIETRGDVLRRTGKVMVTAAGMTAVMSFTIGMLVFGLLAEHVRDAHRPLVVVAVLCFTMGLQNALITRIGAWLTRKPRRR